MDHSFFKHPPGLLVIGRLVIGPFGRTKHKKTNLLLPPPPTIDHKQYTEPSANQTQTKPTKKKNVNTPLHISCVLVVHVVLRGSD